MSTTDDDQGVDVVDVGDAYLEEDIKHVEYTGSKRTTTPGARYMCPYGCGKLVAIRTIDYHKNNGCGRRANEGMLANADIKKRYFCCGVCYSEFVTRSEFHAHLRIEHDVHPEINHITFKDRATFDRFLRWLEMEGGAHFRHKSGSKRRGRGRGIFMACNRSGFVSSPNNGNDVNRERTGPYRLGYSCTAFIHGTEHEDGHVTAEVCGDHYGHDSRMRLPNVVKQMIAQKQIDGESHADIINYLREHFLPLAVENIFAQRVCFVDNEELKNIYVCNTKKWEIQGIPTSCEIWEEELLDRAGIERTNMPRLRHRNDKTTQDMALEEEWPRPRVFVAKARTENGLLVPIDDNPRANIPSSSPYGQHAADRFIVEEYGDEFDQIEEDTVDEPMVKQEIVVHEVDDRENMPLAVPVPIREVHHQETVVDDGDPGRLDIVQEQIASSVSEDVVQVANTSVETLQEQLTQIAAMENGDYAAASTSRLAEHLLEEIEEFKTVVMRRALGFSPSNLKSAIIRMRSIRSSMEMNENNDSDHARAIFPQNARVNYRPGRITTSNDVRRARIYGRGDVTLLPIEDEISDDESLIDHVRDCINYNPNFWN